MYRHIGTIYTDTLSTQTHHPQRHIIHTDTPSTQTPILHTYTTIYTHILVLRTHHCCHEQQTERYGTRHLCKGDRETNADHINDELQISTTQYPQPIKKTIDHPSRYRHVKNTTFLPPMMLPILGYLLLLSVLSHRRRRPVYNSDIIHLLWSLLHGIETCGSDIYIPYPREIYGIQDACSNRLYKA